MSTTTFLGSQSPTPFPASDVDRVNDCTRCHLSIVSHWRGGERRGKEKRKEVTPGHLTAICIEGD